MRSSSHSLDRLDVMFDDDRAVADAGLVLPACASAAVPVAYQLQPYRFGVPVVLVLLGSWFAWLQVRSQDGLTQTEGEPLAYAAAAGIIGWLLGMLVLRTLRRQRAVST